MKHPIVSSVLLCAAASAQSNVINGLDVSLNPLGAISILASSGAAPAGVRAIGISTTSCNVGTVTVPWQAQPASNHPLIINVVYREANGRFSQVSSYGHTKHGFVSTNSPGCATCIDPGTGALLGIGCSDTYGAGLNGDHYYSGHSDELDPWLNIWNPVGSFMDRGYPDVGPPANTDGQRSLNSTMANTLNSGIGFRVSVTDQDVLVPGATFYFLGGYMVRAEADGKRDNNYQSRRCTFTQAGSGVTVTIPTTNNPQTAGEILNRWAGATVTSNTNGQDDGRVFIGVRVTGPVAGLYHYEVAVHNRDNRRGVSEFRLPICTAASVSNAGFRDIDQNAANEWSFVRNAGELVWNTTTNPLKWNMLFNFWFDSDAAPGAVNATLVQAAAGPGQPTFAVGTSGPIDVRNLSLGAGCGTPAAPVLGAVGIPARASIGNQSYGVRASGLAAGANTLFLVSALGANVNLNASCTLWVDPTVLILTALVPAHDRGAATLLLPVPNDPSLEGGEFFVQALEIQAGTGAVAGTFDLSSGLRVKLGNANPGCP